MERLRRDDRSRQDDMLQRVATLNAEIDNLTANMLAGVVSPTVARMLSQREEEAATLRARLEDGDLAMPKVLPHPALRARLEARIADPRRSLSDPENRSEVAKMLERFSAELNR